MMQQKHCVVALRDISAPVFEALLDYIYNGEVNIEKENLAAFMTTAESLEIEGLSEFPGTNYSPIHKEKAKAHKNVAQTKRQMDDQEDYDNEDYVGPSKWMKTSEEYKTSSEEVGSDEVSFEYCVPNLLNSFKF